MFSLKPIDPGAVPKALEKAERYRLLNEPEEAESICLDVLAIEPEHQQALVMLLLSLSDQFRTGSLDSAYTRAQALLPKLHDEYARLYYAGILCERRGSAHLDRGGLGSRALAYTWLHEAMGWYEKAEAVRPPHNDDALLRWNTCVRIIAKHDLRPSHAASFEPVLGE
jgi:hypothetical protein